jgi:S1-C subfamily serine protease
LSLGALLAPSQEKRARPPAEAAAPLLNLESERRASQTVLRWVYDDAKTAAPYVVALRSAKAGPPRTVADYGPVPAAAIEDRYGVAVASSRVLTHVEALRGGETMVLTSGHALAARPVAFDPSSGAVLLDVPGVGLSGALLSDDVPMAGDVLAAVGRTADGYWAAPAFVASPAAEVYEVDVHGGRAAPGTPLFDREGGLVAIVAPSGKALAARSQLARLEQMAPRGLPATLGLVLQEMTSPLRERLGDGALVADVDPKGPAWAAIRPGDVVTRLADRPIADRDGFVAALASVAVGDPVPLALRRAGKEIHHSIAAVAALGTPFVPAHPPGEGALATDVFARAGLEEAAVPVDARVLSVDLAPPKEGARSRGRATRGRAFLVYLQHGGQRFFAAVPSR